MTSILKIDTSDNKKILVELKIDNNESKISSKPKDYKSQETLTIIDKLLKKNKYTINQVGKIWVKVDSGSFTGIRVGSAIANALGYLLKIPINNKKIGENVLPDNHI